MVAAARTGSAPVDSLRKRERQIMAAAYDLAKKDGAFSVSFVAKRTSVKALVYFNAPRSAFAHSDTEEPEAVEDGPEQDDGGQDDSAAPTREARTVPPDELQPGPWIPAQRPSAHKNGTLVHCAQGASIPKVITGQRPKTIRVDRNALSACSDGASSKRTASTASSAAAKRTHVVREARTSDSDAMEEDSLSGLATQEGAGLPSSPCDAACMSAPRDTRHGVPGRRHATRDTGRKADDHG